MSDALAFDIGGTRTEVVFSAPEESLRALHVYDETTRALFGSGVEPWVAIPAGEKAKSWRSVESVLERGATLGLGRDDAFVGVGGGVVCDVASFAASLYMRGCSLALVPTTLLAMVDASLGGKTGIDFLGYKNLVGTFYPARRICIDVSFLKTLPEREYRSGLAEVIKAAIIGDPDLFFLLEASARSVLAREPGTVEEVVRRSLAVKGAIVHEDPRETGRRAVLNLGHTFGHALESATRFTGWTHGEAVAWGMGRALAAGTRLGLTGSGFRERVESLLRLYGFRLSAGTGYGELAPAFARDKKKRQGRVRIVIPRGLCDVVLREVSDEDLSAALQEGQM
ncbi:MAG TPA: 3-dehydroquinate synthase family protein [Spirochaetia bacterium]|nr:3-dehydroquinate synthase family protein [Spirochaetia bacterium]